MLFARARNLCVLPLLLFGCGFSSVASPARAADPEGEAPDFAKTSTPGFVKPFLGRHGLPEPWCSASDPLSMNVVGLDRWQANHFIVYRKETADYLDTKYTPTKVEYHQGLFPSLEKIVAEFTTPGQTDRERALALLTKAMPKYLLHPTVPPKRAYVRPNRGFDDEAIVASGCAWCCEQSRVFVRLCQIAGVPARMLYLFYANGKDGHTASEFFADGHWCMADSSYFCVFPDARGRPLSAAELHTPGHKPLMAGVYAAHCAEILKLSDEQLAPTDGDKARKSITGWMRKLEKVASGELLDTHGPEDLGSFGLLNYPLPPVGETKAGVKSNGAKSAVQAIEKKPTKPADASKPVAKSKPAKPAAKPKKRPVEMATVVAGEPAATRYRFDAELKLAAGSPPVMIRVLTADPKDPLSPAAGLLVLRSEGEEAETLTVSLHNPNAGKQEKAIQAHFRYLVVAKAKKPRPATAASKAKEAVKEAEKAEAAAKAEADDAETKAAKAELAEAQREAAEARTVKNAAKMALAQQIGAATAKRAAEVAMSRQAHSAVDHWIPVAIEVDGKSIAVWVEGGFVGSLEMPAGAHGAVAVFLPTGNEAQHAEVSSPRESLFEPLDLSTYANDRFPAPFGESRVEAGGIEFRLPRNPQNQFNLRFADWPEWRNDGVPWATEGYDVGPRLSFDPQFPILRVPCMDYVAAHVLAVADDDPNLTSTLTLRPRSHRSALQWDFRGHVPRASELAELKADQVAITPAGRLAHVVIPIGAVAQDLSLPQAYRTNATEVMEIELTKEVRTAVIAPLACRWRYRPLGLSSGVRIAAITMEKAPLQMRVTSQEIAHAFVEPGKPVFQIRLENITSKTQPYTLVARAQRLDGVSAEARAAGSVEAGKATDVSMELSVPKRGYYTLEMVLTDGAKRELVRRTSFALLPPGDRKHRDESPFGAYGYGNGSYGVPNSDDTTGPLYVKMGMRYAMGVSNEGCKKYGLLHGLEPNILASKKSFGAEAWRKAIERDPDQPPYAISFHEASVSGNHMTRVPDLFVERPYELTVMDQQHWKEMLDNATNAFQSMRKEFPGVKIALVNGPVPTLEPFLIHHFPADLFDSAGNEAGCYNRPPEAQPPDWIANNASLWMERKMLDAYGYKDKPITQCHEICYPNTSPGNLSLTTQADYFVRHAMHSLAWGIPQIRMGIIADVGPSYYYSNWGASGYCNCYPELNVKPSFVAMATMTWVLDGAKFRKVLDLGSPSLYGFAFDRPDGQHAICLWTVRGHRPVRLKFKSAAGAECQLVDDQANESYLPVKDRAVEVTLSPTPTYLLTRAELDDTQPGAPRYDEKPAAAAAVLSDLASLDDWTLETGHNALLEYYNFLEPRRLGDFVFQPVKEFEGRNNVLQVTPRFGADIRESIAMPSYAVLKHNKGIPVPGTPTEIGLWVNGNSSWGRIIYELADASGQRWISVGNPLSGWTEPFDDNRVPDTRFSTRKVPIDDWCDNDSFGWSRLDFDGWRYVAFPAPGQYPGEGYHWPGNVQWFHDKDGLVHYPLTFKKLIVQLPSKTLHVKDFSPAPRKEIYLKDLTSAQEDVNTYMLKTTSDARPIEP